MQVKIADESEKQQYFTLKECRKISVSYLKNQRLKLSRKLSMQ
jgi:hypothetical protein